MSDIPYQNLAKFYDYFADCEADSIYAEKIQSYLKHKSSLNLLDIGCGTGTFTVEFVRAGYLLDAIDLSPVMIDVARQKAKESLTESELTRLKFQVADIDEYDSKTKYDALLLLTDTMNHINPISMLTIPKRLSDLTADNGLIIFDLLKHDFLAEERGDNTWYVELPDADDPKEIMVWENYWDEDNEIATSNFTFFTAENNLYRRSTDTVTEYFYDHTALINDFLEHNCILVDKVDYPERRLIILQKTSPTQ